MMAGLNKRGLLVQHDLTLRYALMSKTASSLGFPKLRPLLTLKSIRVATIDSTRVYATLHGSQWPEFLHVVRLRRLREAHSLGGHLRT